MRFRCIKPNWGIRVFPDGKENKTFVRDIPGYKVYEGDNFSQAFLRDLNEKGYNIYYFPNGTSQTLENGEKMNGRHVDKFDWLYVDMDLKDKKYKSKEEFIQKVKEFPLKPSWGLDSGNGIHIYWRIEGVNRLQFMELQLRLIAKFNTDPSVYTPLQLMRYPGCKNTKDPNNFKQVLQLSDFPFDPNEKPYSYFDFNQRLDGLTPEAHRKVTEHNDKLEGKLHVNIGGDIEELPDKFIKLAERNTHIYKLFHHPTEVKADRSGADMALANLLFTYDFDRDDAIRVIYNSQKARTRAGSSRFQYAVDTVSNAYSTNNKSKAVPNMAFYRDNPDRMKELGQRIKGPYFIDSGALAGGWRKGQMLGLVGGAGIGKTSFSLKIFKEFITNNPESDDIFFLVGIEMNAAEYYEKWRKLVGNSEEHYERLYIIDEDYFVKNEIAPNIQNIYQMIRDTAKASGKAVGAVCIDHLHIIHGDFDTTTQPLFGADTSQYVVSERSRNNRIMLDLDGICEVMKKFCRQLNCFLILQSQTTKEKDDGGDIPIGKNASFGTSKFEWYCDYVIGMWQPLKRVSHKCKEHKLFVTAFQYNKIRHQNATEDTITPGNHYLLKFLPQYEDYVDLTSEDYELARELQDQAIKMREAEKNKRSKAYYRAPVKLQPKGEKKDEKIHQS